MGRGQGQRQDVPAPTNHPGEAIEIPTGETGMLAEHDEVLGRLEERMGHSAHRLRELAERVLGPEPEPGMDTGPQKGRELHGTIAFLFERTGRIDALLEEVEGQVRRLEDL